MKCPKCGEEYSTAGVAHWCSYGRRPIQTDSKPNPSPRDIFAHIENPCERKAFDEFCGNGFFAVQWTERLTDGMMKQIKDCHPDWYSWLQSKGLVKKEKVKKVVSGMATWGEGEDGIVFPSVWEVNGISGSIFTEIKGKSGKLTFEYEVEEK